MPISGSSTTLDQVTVELHWMQETDLAMATVNDVAVPALCGAWVDPDPPLMQAMERGDTRVTYTSCPRCDLLAHLRSSAMSA